MVTTPEDSASEAEKRHNGIILRWARRASLDWKESDKGNMILGWGRGDEVRGVYV
jgi:hypothetical protein